MLQISEQIKERLDVATIVSQYVKLTKAGTNLRGLCPFHKEKTPSFMVSPEKQIWHCFGCHEGGDIFKFIMKYENLEFSEALKVLAKQASIELKAQDPKIQSEISRLYAVCQSANNFFREQLKKSLPALKYLQERGLKKETIEEWQLGWIENKFDHLFQSLIRQGFKADDIAKAGLAFQSATDSRRYFDRFRGRIIFPIFDSADRIVGFTGRIFGREENPKEPKYLNSPETLIFNKRRILYGFSKNKKEIRDANQAVLVEGQMDTLMAWQAGLKNVIASSGTAITEDQLQIIKRLAKELVISYDMDIAGQLATERAIDLAKQADLTVAILSLPDQSKDLGEYFLAQPNGKEVLLSNKMEAGEYYYQKNFKSLDKKDREAKNKATQIFLTKISQFPSSLERAHWLSKLANDLNIREVYLAEELNKIILEKEKWVDNSSEERKKERNIFKQKKQDLLSDLLIALFLKNGDLRDDLERAKNYFSVEYVNLAEAILKNMDIPGEMIEKIGYLNLLTDYEFDDKEVDFKKEFTVALEQLKKEILKEAMEEKSLLIKQAEQKNDIESLKKYLGELNELMKNFAEF